MTRPSEVGVALPLAEKCAIDLEHAILAGELEPGQRLDEVALGERLGVSRNTLREAFRLAAHHRLVEHIPNRGVFVCTVDSAAARQMYAVRRHLELGALDDLAHAVLTGEREPDAQALAVMERSVDEGERASERDDWFAVGTANAHFHMALVELGGNPTATRFMRALVGQTRLRFLTLGNPRAIHESFLAENRRICELVKAGRHARARAALEVYLLRAADELA